MQSDLSPFFCPRGVAIFGASTNPTKVSHGILKNMLKYGYAGTIAPINPKAQELLGIPCYPDLASAPGPLDLAVIVLPAESVLSAVSACGQRGIRSAIIISGGFKEVGPQGAALEQAVLAEAARFGIRLLGPNCVGALDLFSNLDATFIEGRPDVGGIGFISQSGAVGGGIIDQVREKGIGFANFISLGNEADLTETDFIDYLRNDPHTRVIAAYVEMIRDGQRFMQSAAQTTPHKPIVLLKAGRTQDGARAVSSHTGSLAGAQAAYQAAFKQSGVIEVETVTGLVAVSQALDLQPLPAGGRVALVTNAGGTAALISDGLAAEGLQLADLSADTQLKLRAALKAAAQVANPVDMLGGPSPADYELAVKAVLDDPNVDAVIPILVPQALVNPVEVAHAIAAAAEGSHKPVLVCFMGEWSVSQARLDLHARGIPMYTAPEITARVLGAMRRYAVWRAQPPAPVRPLPIDSGSIRSMLTATGGQTVLGEAFTRPLLSACGIALVPGGFAANAQAAKQMARQTGYPVAIKVVSPDILHKSDVGGIALNIRSDEELEQALVDMMVRVRNALPQARIEGVLVEAMAFRGQEVILGMRRDPNFGPLMMFGLGGTAVELFGDVSFRVAPLTERDVRAMIAETHAGRLLSGFRGQPPIPLEGIIDAMLRLSQLALAFSEIEEMEINPLLVAADGRALALDGRVLLKSA